LLHEVDQFLRKIAKMLKPRLITLIATLCLCATVRAQEDSTLPTIQAIPLKYISNIDSKVEKYSKRITSKTIKTLEKLSRWETKLHTTLEKVNPEAANRLFGNNQLTFSTLLQQLKQGEATVLEYQQQYDYYRDNLATGLQYLETQKEKLDIKVVKKITATKEKVENLNEQEDKSVAIRQFISQRKKQLVNEAFQYLGKSKYLTKINKEAWYYAETIKNYKELFNDEEKAEQTAKMILSKIPAFQKFMQENSMFASLFGRPGDVASAANIAGLQTRASVQSLIQDRIAAGGQGAQQVMSQNIQQARAEISKLKDKLFNKLQVGGDGVSELDFKPNMQKTKTFLQRVEYGSNLQFARTNNLLPATMDIALTVGYKLNDNKSTAGIGLSYKMGLGSIEHISITHQGIGLRSFIDWKLKKQFFIAGGYELNHNAAFTDINQLKSYNAWQHSALLGITKKMNLKTKWTKGTNIQLLYDFLHTQHIPITQPVLLRIGYIF
jgi:hypothetical protein